MNKSLVKWVACAVLVWLGFGFGAQAADEGSLWQIGAADGKNSDFNLAPDQWVKFKADGFFVVGVSDAKRDWPYVHPGPADGWAGSRQHTFTIMFALKSLPTVGECRLTIRLLDTESARPPQLRIRINGRDFEQSLPPGGGDESIHGQTDKGRRHEFVIRFPSEVLRAGDNSIQITTIRGRWMLYDWIGFAVPAGAELGTVAERTVLQVKTVSALCETNGQTTQPIVLSLQNYGEQSTGNARAASIRVDGIFAQNIKLNPGLQEIELNVPAVSEPAWRQISIEAENRTIASVSVRLKPVRKLTVYVLPHSHTDIGYTEIQTAIEKKQVNNLLEGMALAKRTAGYPAGARFVWNVEVLWAADLYLRRLNTQQQADFFAAVKSGQVVLNGIYLNELTGLCRPEELIQLFHCATQISELTGVPIRSAMISDVPGYTWGTVTALNQAGIKYFSVAPNYFDRIGTILREWENKPFYWVGPDGQSKVLVWIPFQGYAMSHIFRQLSPERIGEIEDVLAKANYPYDIAYVRWAGHGDNAVPDPEICESVKNWNAKYAWPKLIISGTTEAFQAFENKFGNQLPLVRGDWTPYWEDGAGSSARETAMNRQSSDRLTQAETLFAMTAPAAFPKIEFADAWRNVLLYSEHTWGADCSISKPDSKKTQEQWEIKKSYADHADEQSRKLLKSALNVAAPSPANNGVLEVVNTLSWPRTELATVSAELSAAGDRVTDEQGRPVPSQRLRSGELVFLAKAVPAFGAQRYIVLAGTPHIESRARAEGATLDSGVVRAVVDEKTGGIVELTAKGLDGNFADTRGGESLNDFRYLIGDDVKNLQRNGLVKISVGEAGPLVASLVIESDAPGCAKLRRELRVIAGMDFVEAINLVDKTRLNAASYHKPDGKESLNFAFPFNVPDGELQLDIPLGVMQPERDQMPGACKNWLTVGRWADVSNRERGVTWVTLDAPLIEVGSITATLLDSQTNPDVWCKHIGRTQTIYSWAMNNHWGTNYRAYQEGPVRFRFVLRPHRQSDPAENTCFATSFSEPLLTHAAGHQPIASLLKISPSDVLVSALKPSDDGKALIVRLFGASGQTRTASLDWVCAPKAVYLSDTSEKAGQKINGPVSVPGFGLVTLRVELP